MSETPRTDALPRIRQAGETEYVPIDDCRQIEHELAEAKEENKRLIADMILHERMSSQFQDERDMLAEVLEQFVNVCDHAPPVDIIKHIGESCASARKALAAVKGGEA